MWTSSESDSMAAADMATKCNPHSPPSVGPSRPESPEGSTSSDDRSSRKRASSQGRTANKVCRVCGDKAFSYNFNVITCESCKAFFRRNANKVKEIQCPFNNNCDINMVSRRFCQRCRLHKCFEVGMKKEWIMTDEARLEKKARVEENREKRLADAIARGGGGRHRTSSMATSSRKQPTRESTRLAEKREKATARVERGWIERKSRQRIKSETFPPDDLTEMLSSGSPLNMNPATPSSYAVADMLPFPSSPLITHPLLELQVNTTSAHSLADVSAATTATSALDARFDGPTSTMNGGFRPPVVTPAVAGVAVPIAAPGGMLIQQQLAAAVAAVASAPLPPPLPVSLPASLPPLASPLSNSLSSSLSTTPLASTPIPIPPPVAPSSSMIQSSPLPLLPGVTAVTTPSSIPPPPPTAQAAMRAAAASPPGVTPQIAPSIMPPAAGGSMVTIPRDVFLRLMSHSAQQQMTQHCSCTCACGYYPPGQNIVDKVTEELLANSQCSECEAREENAIKVPTSGGHGQAVEVRGLDFLLPPTAEQSSVTWLNSNPNVAVDGIKEDAIPRTRRDSIYGPTSVELDIAKVDPDCTVLTQLDQEQLTEIEAAKVLAFDEDQSGDNIRKVVRFMRQSPVFLKLSMNDQQSLLRSSWMNFMVIYGVLEHDPTEWSQSYSILDDGGGLRELSVRLYSLLSADVRSNKLAIILLALLSVFNTDVDDLEDRASVVSEHTEYSRLIKRYLFSNLSDQCRAVTEHRLLVEKLPQVREWVRESNAPSDPAHPDFDFNR